MTRRSSGNQRFFKLHQLAHELNGARQVSAVLETLTRSITDLLQVRGCALFVLSPDRQQLLPLASHGLSDPYFRTEPHPLDGSSAAVLTEAALVIEDLRKDPRLHDPPWAHREGVRAMLGVRFAVKGEPIGVLQVYNRRPRRFSEQDVQVLEAAADIAALALESARAHELASVEEETGNDLLRWYAARSSASPAGARPVAFAHPSEREFARLLDFYRIRWEYEPRSFPLAWDGDRPTELFTPDFYLPDLDLYIELTTLKQSRVTRKNRKVRRFRELYPDLNIRLLYRRDYAELLAKYGYTTLDEGEERKLGRVVYTAEEIQERVAALGQQITEDYRDHPPVLLGVLKGVACFMTDLMRAINLPVEVEYLALSPYEAEEQAGKVHFLKDVGLSLQGRHVLVVEDIIDTGMTLHYLLEHLRRYGPASLEVCVLLDKRVRRLADLPLRYVGFEAPDEFLVGYGLDYREKYRNLPFIATLNPSNGTKGNGQAQAHKPPRRRHQRRSRKRRPGPAPTGE